MIDTESMCCRKLRRKTLDEEGICMKLKENTRLWMRSKIFEPLKVN